MRRSILALSLLLSAPAFAAMQAKPVEWTVGKDRFRGTLVYNDSNKTRRPGLVMVPNSMVTAQKRANEFAPTKAISRA